MKKQELIVSIGLPGCGKTTWAMDFIKHNPEYYNFNRDDMRLMLQGRGRYNKFTKVRENVVTDIMQHGVEAALKEGKSVIISDTNLDPNRNMDWNQIATNCGATYKEQLFTDVPMGLCLLRDSKREYPVGQGVIEGMFKKYRNVYWPKPAYNKDLKDCYIVDVDGTIAEMHNRRPYDWNKVGDDLPKTDVIDIVNTLSHNNKIIILSGRDGCSQDLTEQWLEKHGVQYDEIYMRAPGDSTVDYKVKEDLYNQHIKGVYNVKGVFDDRDQIVFQWRHLGLTCLQINYGAF